MNFHSPDITRKNCVFLLRLQNPSFVLQKILQVFGERGIVLENLHLQTDLQHTDWAQLQMMVTLEKDRIYRTLLILRRIPGVESAEKLEGK